jgi:hypothetical protein
MRRFPIALVLPLFLVACQGGPRFAPMVGGSVDTFEDGNLQNVLGHTWESIAEGDGARTALSVDPGGFDGTSNFHLAVSGVRPAGESAARVTGVRAAVTAIPAVADPDQEPIPRDVSAFDGLSLALRGTPGTYIVQLGAASVSDFDYFNAYIEVGESWSTFRLPFGAFNQEGFGAPVSWTGSDITHIAVFANMDGFFMFGVDDVRFYND